MVEEGRLNVIWLDLSVLDILAAETDGLKQGDGQCIQLCYSRVTIPCDLWPFLHFSPKATAHWLAEVVHPFGIKHAMFGTDRLKPIR